MKSNRAGATEQGTIRRRVGWCTCCALCAHSSACACVKTGKERKNMIKMGFEQLRKQNTLQGKEEPRQQAWDGIGYGK